MNLSLHEILKEISGTMKDTAQKMKFFIRHFFIFVQLNFFWSSAIKEHLKNKHHFLRKQFLKNEWLLFLSLKVAPKWHL